MESAGSGQGADSGALFRCAGGGAPRPLAREAGRARMRGREELPGPEALDLGVWKRSGPVWGSRSLDRPGNRSPDSPADQGRLERPGPRRAALREASHCSVGIDSVGVDVAFASSRSGSNSVRASPRTVCSPAIILPRIWEVSSSRNSWASFWPSSAPFQTSESGRRASTICWRISP